MSRKKNSPFIETVYQLATLLAPRFDPDNLYHLEDTYVWLDVIATPQRDPAAMPSLPGMDDGPDLLEVRDTIVGCTRGVIMVVDPARAVMRRAWCLAEVWMAAYYGDETKIKIAFPSNVTVEDYMDFERLCAKVNMTATASSRPRDKATILQYIKKVLRSAPAEYCALLLQSGEYCRCQQVLYLMDELDEDLSGLETMRELFMRFDADKSGTLDWPEFLEVLLISGFEPDDARKVFVEASGGTSNEISIAVWEQWWIKSQRAERTKSKTGFVTMSSAGLVSNVEKLAVVCERYRWGDLEAIFNGVLPTLRLVPNNKMLMAEPLRGEWASVVEALMSRLHTHDTRAAAKLLYDLIVWNADSLDYNPMLMPSYESVKNDRAGMQKALALYLLLFSQMLQHQRDKKPTVDRLMSYAKQFSTSAEVVITAGYLELRAKYGKENNGAGEPSFASYLVHSKIKEKISEKKSKQDLQRYDVVRRMIELKYGSGFPIFKDSVKEAEVALGQWAAKKRGPMEAMKGVRGEGVKLSEAYFGNGSMIGSLQLTKEEAALERMLDMNLVNLAKIEDGDLPDKAAPVAVVAGGEESEDTEADVALASLGRGEGRGEAVLGRSPEPSESEEESEEEERPARQAASSVIDDLFSQMMPQKSENMMRERAVTITGAFGSGADIGPGIAGPDPVRAKR
ncbi:hypothetical protein FOA52_004371 [Chlamydomonas sp. UWO 241]|nr:hypothetical protein FOA52_004371 [Chlamydomonas sp. UWO 241]